MTASKPPFPRRRALRRAAPAASLLGAAAALAVAPAGAGDQTLTGSFSQTFLGDTNTQLEAGGDPSLGAISRLGLNYVNRTPSAQLSLGTGFNFSAFTDENDDNIDGLFPDLSGAYSVRRPTRSLNFNFSGSVRPVDFFENTGLDLAAPTAPDPSGDDDAGDGDAGDADAPDDGETGDGAADGDAAQLPGSTRARRETLRISLSAGASFSRQLTPRASQSASFSASRLDFVDAEGTLTPSTNLSADTGFSQQLTQRASWGVSGGASLFLGEGDESRRTLTVNAAPSLSWSKTPDIRYSASLGPSLSVTWLDERTPTGVDPTTEVSPGVSGNAGLNYTEGVSNFSLSLSQGIVPDDEGVAVNRTGLNAGWSRRISASDRVNARLGLTYRTALAGDDSSDFEDTLAATSSAGWSRSFNPRASGGLDANLRLLDDDAGREATLGLGANLSYRLTEDVSASLGYDFRIQDDEATGDFTSHRVSLTLSRPFTLLP